MSIKLKNEFSWSISRDGIVRSCLRRYYYHYYASWGGWDESAPPLTREIYILKRLKTRHMWVGDLVHRAIQRSITNLSRGVAVLNAERIVEITLNIMRNEFRSSRNGNYRTHKSLGLFEHEYGLDVTDESWKAAADTVENCLLNFYGSPVFSKILNLERGNFLEIETLSHFDFDGTPCWAIMDVAFRDERKVNIADWKTGRSEPGENELQLTCYALYAFQRWGLKPADLNLIEYNLLHDRIHKYSIDAATVERTRSYIRGSIADMQSLLRKMTNNEPLPEERFAKVQKREICTGCNFKKICRPVFE